MTDASTQPRRWRTWILVASLALNLLIIGTLAGFALRGPHPRGSERVDAVGAITLLRAVPDHRRDDLRAALREQRGTMRARRAEIAKLRTDFLTVLEAEELDEERMRRLLGEHRAVADAIATNGQEILMRVILDMDHAERIQFVENARKMTKPDGRRKPRR